MNRFWSNTEGCLSVLSEDVSYEKMEEDLTCPVCLELYADPLMMPCSHSVCKACLQDIMKSREKSGKQDLECPACRETHHLSTEQVNQLPKNLALENIVFRYQEIRSCSLSRAAQLASPPPPPGSQLQLGSLHSPAQSQSHDDSCSRDQEDSVFEDSSEERLPCGMCEEPDKNEADWFCPQCQVLYCQLCLDTFHPRRGSLVKHKVRRPAVTERRANLLFCRDHTSEMASIFCDTCKVVACHLCVCMGQGSHCTHTILDMDTATRQLQETVQMTQDKLSALVATFSERESTINTHIENLKVMEDCARNSITSQYNCIMSDIAATLDLARQKSLSSISQMSSLHSSYLLTRSHHVRALLSRCEDLSEACQGFLSTDNDNSVGCSSGNQSANSSFGSSSRHSRDESSLSGNWHSRDRSTLAGSGHSGDGSTLSGDGSTLSGSGHSGDRSTLSGNGHSGDGSTRSGNGASSEGNFLSARNDAKTSQDGDVVNKESCADGCVETKMSPRSGTVKEKDKLTLSTNATDCADGGASSSQQSTPRGKSLSEMGKTPVLRQNSRSSSESKHRRQSLLMEGKSASSGPSTPKHTYVKRLSMDNIPQISSLSAFGAGAKVDSRNHSSENGKQLDVSIARKIATDRTNSERKLSGPQPSERNSSSGANVDTSHAQNSQPPTASRGPEDFLDVLNLGMAGKQQTKKQLLLRADEVGPVLEQVSALCKEVHLDESSTEDNSDKINRDHDQNVSSCISTFQSSTLQLIHNMTAQNLDNCPIITPSVRSVSVASPHQESCISRVQSRILMTWGFNSTTFTADPVTTTAQWTVNVNRNTSHIGDVKSGYLFGVGVSLEALTSKEQVGMSPDSQAVVCINGNLALCHDKQVSPIMPLSDLPLAITISIGHSQECGLFMAYTIRVSGLSKCLQGRRILALGRSDPQLETNGTGPNQTGGMMGEGHHGDKKTGLALQDSVGGTCASQGSDESRGFDETTSCSGGRGGTGNSKADKASFSVHPVFTVSQRVKMQFPHSSDV